MEVKVSNIRDEISKIVDMRIPPNAYRRYLYEIDRTGGFNKKVMLDMLIALCEKVEELETKTEDKVTIPFAENLVSLQAEERAKPTDFQCDKCGKMFTSKIALLGHSRSHQDGKTTDTAKHDA
jgi:hypothetical protein